MDQGQKPVNPYAPAGAPYAPGSNTPPPSFAMPAIPNTGATFTPDEPPEKPKFFTKKFIIAASVGLALIIAAIITGLVLQNNRKTSTNGSSSAQVASTCQSSFNKYASYILTGTASDSSLSGQAALSGSYLSYAFMESQNSSSAKPQTVMVANADTGETSEVTLPETETSYPKVSRTEFLEQSKKYFDEFYNCYIGSDDYAKNPSDLASIDNYRNVLNKLSSLPAAGVSLDQEAAEENLNTKTRVIEELDMINNILTAEASE